MKAFCSKCGAKLRDGACFCSSCGAKIAVNPVLSETKPVQAAPSAPLDREPSPPFSVPPEENAAVQPLRDADDRTFEEQPPVKEETDRQTSAQAPLAQTEGQMRLYVDPKGLTLINHRFEIRNETGAPVYLAETKASFATYKMHLCDLSGAEILRVEQSKKMTLAAMNFELWKGKQFVSHITQKMHMASIEYELPELGLSSKGDLFALNFEITRGGAFVGSIHKKFLTLFGDCYEITVADPADAESVLAFLLTAQMLIIHSRRRRR